jgi:2-phosphosulfolactate phosphatase
MASELYTAQQYKMFEFIRKTTHWHRLAAYGLEKDLEYCVSPNLANILPIYRNGDLVVV